MNYEIVVARFDDFCKTCEHSNINFVSFVCNTSASLILSEFFILRNIE